MLELGQFHLQLAFVAAGALGEDVQDQAGAIQHAAFQEFLQVALLAGRKRIVDQYQIRAGGFGRGLDLFQLAAADQGGRIGPIDAGGEQRRDAGAGGAGQIGEFLGGAIIRRAAGVGLDQEGVFAFAGTFEHGKRFGLDFREDPVAPGARIPSHGGGRPRFHPGISTGSPGVYSVSSSSSPAAPPSLDCT